jgi:hypothetical protein
MPGDPKNIDQIKADAKMMGAYLAYAKRRAILNEVTFYFAKGNPEGLYSRYLDPKAKEAVNVDAKVTNPAKLLAGKEDWKNPAWTKIIASGKDQVASALNGDIAGFMKSAEYADYLKKEKMGDPTKAAKLLGIKDVKALKQGMEMMATGNESGAKKIFEKIAKDEKLKDKAEAMMKALEKAGMA